MTPLNKYYQRLHKQFAFLMYTAFLLAVLLTWGAVVVYAQETATPVITEEAPVTPVPPGTPATPDEALNGILALLYIPVAAGAVAAVVQLIKSYVPIPTVALQLFFQIIAYALFVAATQFNLLALYERAAGLMEVIIPMLPVGAGIASEVIYQVFIKPTEKPKPDEYTAG